MIRQAAVCGLVIALLAAIVALVASWRALAIVKAERAQLVAWQSGIVRQLARAGSSERGTSLAPADASEALAEIIASRESAIKLLGPPAAYSLAAPTEHSAQSKLETGKAGTPDTITHLLNRRSTGAAAEDVQAIDQDSQTPWNGWE